MPGEATTKNKGRETIPAVVSIGSNFISKNLPLNGKDALETISKELKIRTSDEKLGVRITEVEGMASSHYHYAFYDPKTGKYFVPRVWDEEAGKWMYLDLRNILLIAEKLKGLVLEITLVYGNKDNPNSFLDPITGKYGNFELEEIAFSGSNCTYSSQPSDVALMQLPTMDYGNLLLHYRLKNLAFFDAHRCFVWRKLEASVSLGYQTPTLNSRLTEDKKTIHSLPSPKQFSSKANNVSFFQLPTSNSNSESENENFSILLPFAEKQFATNPMQKPASQFSQNLQEKNKELFSSMQNNTLSSQETGLSIKQNAQDAQITLVKRQQSILNSQLLLPNATVTEYTKVSSTTITSKIDSNLSTQSLSSKNISIRKIKQVPPSKNSQEKTRKQTPTSSVSTHVPVPLSSIKRLKAVIFDLDGVVVNTMELHRKSFNDLLAPLGIHVSSKAWMKQYGGMHSEQIMKQLFEKHGIKYDVSTWVQKRTALYLKYQEKASIPAIEGFKQFHHFLIENNVKVAVASSGHASHVKSALAKIGLPNIKVVAIENVRWGRGKPHPDLFLLAAKKLKAKKGTAVVFEDAPAGIEAARRAKMPCIALATSLPQKKLAGKAALVVKNFRSKPLMRLISSLLGRKGKLRLPQARAARLSR